jgi:hypothetical protein
MSIMSENSGAHSDVLKDIKRNSYQINLGMFLRLNFTVQAMRKAISNLMMLSSNWKSQLVYNFLMKFNVNAVRKN